MTMATSILRVERAHLAPADWFFVLASELDRLGPVVFAHWGQCGRDALDDAPAHVWEHLGQFDPARGGFRPWCRAVLWNLVRSKARDRRRQREALCCDLASPADAPSVAELVAGRQSLDDALRERMLARWHDGGLFETDLRLIQQWPPQDRVLLLCLAGVWHMAPRRLKCHWLATAFDIPPAHVPVVADQLLKAETPLALSEILGVHANTITQRWRRHRHRLAQLDALRELLVAV